MLLALPLLLIACTGPEEPGCAVTQEPVLLLGDATGDDFIGLSGDIEVSVAPQGGYGLQARVMTTGLISDANVSVSLETRIDDTVHASFDNTTRLFCDVASQTGRIWGIAFPLDGDLDTLSLLDGYELGLFLTMVDEAGTTATGNSVVTLVVPD